MEVDGIPIPPGVKATSITSQEKFQSKYFIGLRHLRDDEMLFFPINVFQYKPPNTDVVKHLYEGVHRLDIYTYNYKPYFIVLSEKNENHMYYPVATVIAWDKDSRAYKPIDVGNDAETIQFVDDNYSKYKYYMVDNIKILVRLHHKQTIT